MQWMRDDRTTVRLSGSSLTDIPPPLRGVEVRLIKPVAYSSKYGSTLYSAETETGEHWIIRADWFEEAPNSG